MQTQAHRLQRLPRQALSPLPIAGPCAMAGGSTRRAAGYTVLSCRLHAAGAHCRHRLSEQGARLQPALPRHRRDATHHRCRPQASRRRDRFLRRAAHLGAKFVAPPPSALRRPGWRVFAGRTRWIACKKGFFLPVRVSHACFDDCSWSTWRKPSTRASCNSSLTCGPERA